MKKLAHHDQTTLEESFFFCEYAKRRFEMSDENNGEIEMSIDNIDNISRDFFHVDTPKGMIIDMLTDIIYIYEAKQLGFQYNSLFKWKKIPLLWLNIEPRTEDLLRISNSFKVSAAFLPFPYDMAEVAMRIKHRDGIPIKFNMLEKKDRRCIAIDTNSDYVFFGVDKILSLDEMIGLLKKESTLFKFKDALDNATGTETLKAIHKESKSGSYRQSLHNTFYKSIGLLMYDLYISNNFCIESAFENYRSYYPEIKCDPSKKQTSEDCLKCKYYSSCRNLWTKNFKFAVEKISGAESNEEYLNRIKNKCSVKKLTRRTINFFEYNFYSEKEYFFYPNLEYRNIFT